MSLNEVKQIWNDQLDKALDRLPGTKVLAAIVALLAMALLLALFTMFGGKSPSYLERLTLPESLPFFKTDAPGTKDDVTDLAELQQREIVDPDSSARAGANRNNLAFSDAFRDLIKKPDLKPGEFLPVDYNLAEQSAVKANVDPADGSLTVQKPLFVNGVNAGAATIRIESGAQILIATSSVAKALGDRAEALPSRITSALANGSGFIPFYELRSAGIQVEYDAARDRVSFSMPS